MAFTPKEVAELHTGQKKLLEVWMKIKLAIQTAFSQSQVTPEHENAFLVLKSDLSRLNRSVADHLPKDLRFGGDEMMDLMKNATTMQHLHGLPLREKRETFGTWHKIYVLMSRSFGALEVINDGYYPRLHRNLMRMDGGGGKGKSKRRKKKK